MLKTLTNIDAVSGNESNIRKFIIDKVRDFVTTCETDTIGNVILFKKGNNPSGQKVAVFAHMDEVGLIVNDITDDGYLKFSHVGGIDDRILLAQRVKVGENKIKGVIGIKAVHLQTEDERKNVIKCADMYIDIGAKSKDEALRMVSKGDYISFDSQFTELYNTKFKAKAIDDRAGCAINLDLVKKEYAEDIFFCFTVQEETGLRGASVLSRRIDPDIAIILEATTASDTAFSPPHMYGTTLGGGPVITNMDMGAYQDKKLKNFIIDTANNENITFQYKLTSNGGNDSRQIQTGASGARVCSVSLPCRYIHSPVCVADMQDYESMKKLVEKTLENIHTFAKTL